MNEGAVIPMNVVLLVSSFLIYAVLSLSCIQLKKKKKGDGGAGGNKIEKKPKPCEGETLTLISRTRE